MEGKKNGDHESNGHLADDTIQLNMMEQGKISYYMINSQWSSF